MINLKTFIGDKYNVTMEASYRHGGDLDDEHYQIIKGRRGDITAYDDDFLEVTVYGKKLPDPPPGVIPENSHNLALPIKLERMGWKAKNHYDDSTCFIIEKDRIFEAIKYIKASKRRYLNPERRKASVERLARMRSSKISATKKGGLATKPHRTVERDAQALDLTNDLLSGDTPGGPR